LRNELVPLNVNIRWPSCWLLANTISRINRTAALPGEYVLLAGVNDSEAQARALAALIRDIPSRST